MADSTPVVNRALDEARAGSAAAQGELLEACRAYLLGIAERELDGQLRAKGGASDLVQETFLEAHRDFPRFEGSTEAELLAWLRRMLLNNLNNFARQYRGTDKRQLGKEVFFDPHASEGTGTPIAADTPTPSRRAIAGEELAALESALRQLPDDYRDVLTRRYIQGQSFDEIAAAMNRTNNAVRQLWVRAITRLQQDIGPT